jgi:hypothetical protein
VAGGASGSWRAVPRALGLGLERPKLGTCFSWRRGFAEEVGDPFVVRHAPPGLQTALRGRAHGRPRAALGRLAAPARGTAQCGLGGAWCVGVCGARGRRGGTARGAGRESRRGAVQRAGGGRGAAAGCCSYRCCEGGRSRGTAAHERRGRQQSLELLTAWRRSLSTCCAVCVPWLAGFTRFIDALL